MRAHRSNRCLLSRARMNCPCFIQNGDDQFRRRTWKVFTSRFISRYLYFQRFGHGERSRIRITSAWGNRKDIQCTLSWVRQRGVGAQSLRHRIWDRYHIGVLNPACWAERARRENSWVVMSIYWERRRTYRGETSKTWRVPATYVGGQEACNAKAPNAILKIFSFLGGSVYSDFIILFSN